MAMLIKVICLFTIQAMLLMDNAAADPNIDISSTEITPGITPALDINCTFTLENHPDITALVSLSLLRANASGLNFEELAAITEFSPDSVKLVTHEKVAGTGVHRQTGESFLHLSWEFPRATQGGVYQCAAHGVDMLGNNVEFTNTSVVTVDEAILYDILQKLEQMEIHEKSMQNTISLLKSALENKTSSMENTVTSMEDHILSLGNTVTQLRTIVHQLNPLGTYQDKEYYMSRENFQHINESTAVCESVGGTLIEIDDENEYNAVLGFLENISPDIKYVMIGGTDEEAEGNWTLPSTNQPLPFTAWYYGQPNTGTSYNCLELYADASWQMYATYCYRTPPYVGMRATCEIPAV